MKKLSHRQMVLISHLLCLAHPVYFWLRLWTGFQSDLLYAVLLTVNLITMTLNNRTKAQMDEYAERAMKESESICFAVGFCAILLLSLACFLKAPWVSMKTIGLLLLTVETVVMALRGVVFYYLDKQGMDVC